jgi:uncharacterized protein
MHGFVRAAVFGMGLLFAGAAIAEDAKPPPDPARLAAARDLMEVTGVTKQLDGVMDAMKQGVAQGANAENSANGEKMSAAFDAMMAKFFAHKADMMTDFAVLYAETFTAEEMKTVADFYRSGTGAKFIALTPALMQKGAVIGMKYSEKIMKEIKPSPPQ